MAESPEDTRRVYYDHEAVWKRIEGSGGRGWDDLTPDQEHGSYDAYRDFLASPHAPKTGDALELGCGGGQLSFMLARLGFRARGVDFSETAIALARKNARDAGLDVRFDVDDCLHLSGVAEASFDLVVDAHALHCIIEPADRAAFLRSAFRVLRPGGRFFSDTMSREGDLDFARLGIDPVSGILHNRARIWIERDVLRREIEAAGFEIIALEARAKDGGEVVMLETIALSPSKSRPL